MRAAQEVTDSYRNILYDALEHTYECIVLTDPSGNILYMNKPYQKFLHVDDVTGCHVTDVIENTRMHIVAQTGKAEIAAVQRIRGHDMIANRIPIFRDGRLTGVIGTVMFQDVQQLYALADTVERLRKEVDYYKGQLRRKSGSELTASRSFAAIVGSSDAITAALALAQKVARTDTTVMLLGESGTGKELFARGIHTQSARANGPFVSVNCAAIPETLLESELFGYEAGSFTGALPGGRKGKFELAHHGTLLLDEIGDMPLHLQAKLLRVLQEREVERVGGAAPIPVDVRVISSTHRSLSERLRSGQLREDLFYRLNVMSIHIPPLRERLCDITPLTHHFLGQLQKSTGVTVGNIEAGAWRKLMNHAWPGNVRELKNVLERGLHLMETGTLTADCVVFPLEAETTVTAEASALRDVVRRAEKAAIVGALAAADSRRGAAQLLGISKSTLYEKMADLEIDLSAAPLPQRR